MLNQNDIDTLRLTADRAALDRVPVSLPANILQGLLDAYEDLQNEAHLEDAREEAREEMGSEFWEMENDLELAEEHAQSLREEIMELKERIYDLTRDDT